MGCLWGISTNKMPILANVLFLKNAPQFFSQYLLPIKYLLGTTWKKIGASLYIHESLRPWVLLKVGPCLTLHHMCLYFNKSHNLMLDTTHSSILAHSLKTMMAYVKVFSMETIFWLWHAWHFLMFPYLSIKGNNGFSQSLSWKACPIL